MNALAPKNLLLHGRIRSKRSVVLVASLLILAFARHHSDDAKGQIFNTYGLSYRIGSWKQIVGNGLSNDDHARCGAYVGVRKETAILCMSTCEYPDTAR